MGPELGKEAQVCLQTSIAAGQKSDAHLLHVQSGREAHRRRLPGRNHPDLGQELERKSIFISSCDLYLYDSGPTGAVKRRSPMSRQT